MASVAAGGAGQSGLLERGHLIQLNQFDPLYQQLSDAVATAHHDRGDRVEIDQGDFDLPAVTRIDGTRAVDNRKPHSDSQTRAWMHQAHHAERDGDRNAGRHQGPMAGSKFDVGGTVEIDAGIAGMGTTGQRELTVEANNR